MLRVSRLEQDDEAHIVDRILQLGEPVGHSSLELLLLSNVAVQRKEDVNDRNYSILRVGIDSKTECRYLALARVAD